MKKYFIYLTPAFKAEHVEREEEEDCKYRWKFSYLKPTKTELELWRAMHYQKHKK
jgi:hypothetical protein